MAKISSDSINKKNKQTLQALVNLMKDLDQKYSIRVGIIGSNAYAKHLNSGLTNAQLGAIHEFGCTINVTDKMRAYLHHIGIHLKPDTNTIVIPTRSFLRMPLLSNEFKEFLYDNIGLYEGKEFFGVSRSEGKKMAREQNLDIAIIKMEKNPKIMEKIANDVARLALYRINDAFNTGGFGKWAQISAVTKAHRKNDKSSPPLTDSSQLRNSITAEVKKVK